MAKTRVADWDIYVQRGCICEYCGFDGTVSWQAWNQLAIDHIIPRSKGGSPDSAMNKAVACCYCNGHKLWFDPRSDLEKDASMTQPPDEQSRSVLIASAYRHIEVNSLQKWVVETSFEEMMQEIKNRSRVLTEH